MISVPGRSFFIFFTTLIITEHLFISLVIQAHPRPQLTSEISRARDRARRTRTIPHRGTPRDPPTQREGVVQKVQTDRPSKQPPPSIGQNPQNPTKRDRARATRTIPRARGQMWPGLYNITRYLNTRTANANFFLSLIAFGRSSWIENFMAELSGF